MSPNPQDSSDTKKIPFPEFESNFLRNPVYVAVTSKTIKTAENAYRFARFLSIVLFVVGIALLITSIVLSFFKNDTVLTVFFGGLGATNIIALFLYRPIERIQSGVDALIKSQIACISFAAQYDIIMRASAENHKISYDMRLTMAQNMRDLTSRLIADLNGYFQTPPSVEKTSEEDKAG